MLIRSIKKIWDSKMFEKIKDLFERTNNILRKNLLTWYSSSWVTVFFLRGIYCYTLIFHLNVGRNTVKFSIFFKVRKILIFTSNFLTCFLLTAIWILSRSSWLKYGEKHSTIFNILLSSQNSHFHVKFLDLIFVDNHPESLSLTRSCWLRGGQY